MGFLLPGYLSSTFDVTKVDNTPPPNQSNGMIISNIQYFISKSVSGVVGRGNGVA